MQPGSVTVLVVDDEGLIRKGCRALFSQEPRIRVVGEAGNAEEGLAAARALKPRVVVMDVRLAKGESGIALTKTLLSEAVSSSPLDVVILTAYGCGWDKAERAGALGYVDKFTALDELINAVLSVARGRRYVSEARLAADLSVSPWTYKFDGCELDEASETLRVGGKATEVSPGVFAFIAYLVKSKAGDLHPELGERGVVPYEEIQARFSFSPENRRKHVQAARKLLGSKKIIATRRFRGCGISVDVLREKRIV